MSDNPYSDFFFNGDFEIRRSRVLDPSQSESSPESIVQKQNPEVINQDFLNSIYDSYRNTINKGIILKQAISRVANKYTIPVDKNSIEVRRAVLRQDSTTEDGSIITFDLFNRMIDIIERQALNVDYDVINTKVIADPIATDRTIKKKLDSRIGDEDSELLLVASNILILFLLHQITGIWRGTEHSLAQPKTAGPFPTEPVSSAGEAIREAAIGMAAAQIVLGLNQALMQDAMLQGNFNSPNVKTIIEGAIADVKQVKLPPLLEKTKQYLGLEDYKLIVKYVIKYITESTDRGYEFWLGYLITRRTMYLASRNLSLAPIFSNKEYSIKNLQWDVDKPWVEPDNITLQNPVGFGPNTNTLSTQLVSLLNQAVTRPTDAYLCAMDYEATTFEKGLNYIAQILDTKVTRDALCCLVRFLGNIDVGLLKKIATLLRIFLNNNMLDLNATMTNFLSLLVSWIKDTVIRMLLALIQSLIDKIVKIISDFINSLAGDIKYLLQCPLILDLIIGIIEAIDAIIDDLERILDNYVTGFIHNSMVSLGLNNLDASNRGLKPGLLRIHKKRSISRILRILEAIISALEKGITICDEEDKKDHNTVTFDQILDSPLIGDLEDYLDIPQELKDKYFDNAEEIHFTDGTYIPAYTVGVIDIGRPGTPPPDCGDNFDQETIRNLLGEFSNIK